MNRKPNTIVICSDEHHFRYTGYAGHPYVKTPNLDALAREGTVFNNAFCNSPVCTPSRMSFITGKYVSQIGSWFIGVPLNDQEPTWASRLSQAGIKTTMLGKMDFCGAYQSGGFNEYRIIERRGAFEPYPRISPLGSRTKGYIRSDKLAHVLNAGIRKPLYTNGSDGHNDALGFYDHDRMVTQWALEYLENAHCQSEDQPWTLYLGYLMPHWPYTCPEKYFNMYYPDQIEMPFDCELPVNPRLHPAIQEFQRACNLKDITDDQIRKVLAAYCGLITAMDDMLGQVFAKLKELGMYDNVNIIYTSDHGDSCFEHGLLFKQCAYNGSCAVPLIVKGPDFQQRRAVDTPVSLVDLYPTILDFWGLKAETDRPGRSWVPLLKGETDYGMNYVFAEYHGNFFRNDWYMIVRGDYKYVYYINQQPSLFNVKEDPQELHDLAHLPKYQELLDEFEALLRTIVDPEAVSWQSKADLGLIGKNGEDYTQTLTFDRLREGYQSGWFEFQPEFVQYHQYLEEY